MENLKEYMKLTIPEEFGEDIDSDCCSVVVCLAENANEIKECEYRMGASKMCLIPKDSDYVVKIPFNGFFRWNYETDNENFIPFSYAKTENEYDNWNYCLSELEIYNKAKNAGFEMFLAETDYLGASKTGHPLYAQEKVLTYRESGINNDKLSNNSKSVSERIHNVYKKFCYSYHSINNEEMDADEAIGYVFCETGEAFLAMIIETYTYELVEKFSRWVIDEAREISADLHYRNIGFRASDGTPCLLDFSGFYED